MPNDIYIHQSLTDTTNIHLNFILFLSKQQTVEMTLDHGVCLFCLNKSNDGISTFGESEEAENVRNIINQHFWFDVSGSGNNY